jgi:hypothetical protein
MKKADMVLSETGEIILAALVLVFVIAVVWALFGLFVNNKDDATIGNFDSLTARLENMGQGKQTYLLYMNSGYFIASFKGKEDANNMINAPASCDRDCLCLCTTTRTGGKQEACQAVKCFTFKERVTYTTPIFIQGQDKQASICITKAVISGQPSDILIEPFECQQ